MTKKIFYFISTICLILSNVIGIHANPIINGTNDVTISLGTEFDYLEDVKAYDQEGKDITTKLEVTGTVNIYKSGQYTLTYLVEDSIGNITTTNRIISVLPASSILNEISVIEAKNKNLKVESHLIH